MKQLTLTEFKRKNLDKQQVLQTQKVLEYVLAGGPRRPRHCPQFAGGGSVVC